MEQPSCSVSGASPVAELRKADRYGEKVLSSLNSLRSNEEFCDFVVHVEDSKFPVHKTILAAASDYFRVMFSGEMKENREHQVHLKGIPVDAVKQIIDFMYSGELLLSFVNLDEILNAASHLQVLSAVDLCSDYMKFKINFDNADSLKTVAKFYSLDDFLEYLNSMILNDFEEFSHTDMFLELDSTELVDFIRSDRLKISSEYLLFRCVLYWIQYETSESQTQRLASDKVKNRLLHTLELLKCIRFPLMSDDQLNQVRDSSVLTTQVDKQVEGMKLGIMDTTELTRLVIEGIKFGLDCRIGHPLINERTNMRSDKPCMVLIHKNLNMLPFQVIAYNEDNKKFYRLFSSTSGSTDCRVAVIDNFLYIACVVDMGGGSLMNSLGRFDPRHLTMQELRPMKQLRLDSSMVALDKKLYVMGGGTELLNLLNTVEVYDVITNVWSDGVNIPLKSHSHATCTVDGIIYLSGGLTSLNGCPVPDLFSFDPAVGRWISMASMHNARRLHDMVPIGRKIYVLGGIPKHGLHHTSSNAGIPIECYDIDSDTWTLCSSTLNGRSVGHYVALNGQIYSVGHEHSLAKEDEIWVYDAPSDSWRKHMNPHQMSFATAMCSVLHINFHDENVAEKQVRSKSSMQFDAVPYRTHHPSI